MPVTLRELGGTGLLTPPLILGGNVFGWTADEAASFAVLDAFVAAGGRMIDTADVYSAWAPEHRGGESEAVIGRWLKRRGGRNGVMITTKVGMLAGRSGQGLDPKRIADACDRSLARLGVERIDLYLAHRDDEAHAQDDVADAFARLVEAGKVGVIGASNFEADRLANALDLAESSGLPRYEVLQPGYNLLERNRFEGPLQDLCVARGLAATPYSGLANGYLTGKYRTPADLEGSTRGERVRGFMEGRGPAVLAALDAVAEETGASLAAIALAWTAAQASVSAPIASATSAAQVEELAQAMTLELDAGQLDRLTRASGGG